MKAIVLIFVFLIADQGENQNESQATEAQQLEGIDVVVVTDDSTANELKLGLFLREDF
jgi:hypothetical protein